MKNPTASSGPQTYEAGAFDPAVGAGRVSGQLRLKGGMVIFESESTTIELPIRGIEISRGGANHRLTFFKHPDHPGQNIYTKDGAIAHNEQLLNVPEAAAQLKKIRRGVMGRRTWMTTALVILAGILVGGWALKGVLVDVAVDQVPVEWEQQLGDAAFSEIESSGTLVDNAQAVALLEKMTQPLLDAVNDARYPYRFHIARDPSINAFALPGGNIVVHTGLLEASDRPEQVLGVLAHEIAHVTQRHGIRRVADALGTRILIALIFGGTDIPVEWLNAGASLITLRYSRDQESEADAVGWAYLIDAGIDPRGLKEFFDKLHEHHGDLAPPELLSTHPASENRSNELQSRWENLTDQARFQPMDLTTFNALRKSLGIAEIAIPSKGEAQP